MTTAVTGIYPDPAAADIAIARLAEAGFARNQISVILQNTPDHERLVLHETDDMPRGAVVGAVGGGLLATLAFTALTLPGIGILAAGPLVTALTAGTLGTAAGGVLGAMTGHGVSSMAAQEYETEIGRGKVLLAVHTVHGQAKRAKAILSKTGARYVSDSVHRSHGEESPS
jgi:hypothetical protein